jgi:DNA-binding GntR family transcriptional regulator
MKAGSIPHLDVRKLLKLLKKHGFTVERSKKGWIVTSPDGRKVNFHESQLSADPRTYMNTMAELRRSVGFDIRKVVR